MNMMARFARGAPRTFRAVWLMAGVTLAMLVLVELGLKTLFAVKDVWLQPGERDPRLLIAAYGDADWPRAYFSELERCQAGWHSYVNYRLTRFDGAFIHVDERGVRRTWSPDGPGTGRSTKIYVVGGSAAWGYGARDEYTIPSLLARELDQRGFAAEVTNLASIGYVSTQEVITLLLALQGGERPDIVVFLDGANDTLSVLQNGKAGLPLNEANRQVEFNLRSKPARLAATLVESLARDSALFRLAKSASNRLIGPNDGAPPRARRFTPADRRLLAKDVLRCYFENTKAAEALGKAYGFTPRFYWQPVIFTKSRLAPLELVERKKYAWLEPFSLEVDSQLNAFAALNGTRSFRNLSQVFGDTLTLKFIDQYHTTEAANAEIARTIADDLAVLCLPRSHQDKGAAPAPAPAEVQERSGLVRQQQEILGHRAVPKRAGAWGEELHGIMPSR